MRRIHLSDLMVIVSPKNKERNYPLFRGWVNSVPRRAAGTDFWFWRNARSRGHEPSLKLRFQVFWMTMLGNFDVMSFAFSAIFTATLRAMPR